MQDNIPPDQPHQAIQQLTPVHHVRPRLKCVANFYMFARFDLAAAVVEQQSPIRLISRLMSLDQTRGDLV